jgi:hypothetical protein
VNLLKYQRNCKICNSEEWLRDYFAYAIHIERLTYEQIIEVFERHGLSLNFFNCSCHKHRHLEQKDLKKAEETKARRDEIDAKLSTKEDCPKS